jgi:molecular chaperone DnaJ
MNDDFYTLLGLTKDASQDDIKKAYRSLSKKYHPDLNPNNKEAEEKFKKINEAYSVLSEPEKRKQYDNRGSGFGNFSNFNQGFSNFDFFSDFFNFRNNNQRPQQQNQKGSDLRIKLSFSLEEVVHGSRKTIKYNRNVCCSSCKGNGSKEGISLKTCNNCNGQGSVINVVQTPFGRIQTSNHCNICNGAGKIINEICNSCGARGIKENFENIEINVPPGITEGFVYKIENGGNFNNSPNSIPGDLIILCTISEHIIYKKFNNDIHRDVFINFIDAITGTDNFIINVFGEDIRIKIDPNTDNGKILRLKGKGLPNNGSYGDLYVHINVFVPKNLDVNTLNVLSQIKEKIEPTIENINPEIGFLNKSLKINSLYNN